MSFPHNAAHVNRLAQATSPYLLQHKHNPVDWWSWGPEALQEAKPAQLSKRVAIYGQPPQPASRLAMLSYEHAVWTLGQVVPYLRLNGVKPPEYRMPF